MSAVIEASAWETVETPLGELLLLAGDDGLTALYTPDSRGRPVSAPANLPRGSAVLTEARAQLLTYFAGTRTRFTIPLAPAGTDFQRKVWRALVEIPCGERVSYATIAQRIGAPNAVRAVGHANGHNPISIVVPCHRVVGSDGSLTGYGGGLWRKQWLLDHEARLAGLKTLWPA